MQGDYLLKCNKDTDGRHHKFFKLCTDGTLRWTTQEKQMSNPSKIQYYHTQEIRGVVFGKITPGGLFYLYKYNYKYKYNYNIYNYIVFRKKYNAKLESHLCFSLILKTRSLDIYCEEEQVNPWLIALSCEVKKNNPKAYCLSPGKILWRKF